MQQVKVLVKISLLNLIRFIFNKKFHILIDFILPVLLVSDLYHKINNHSQLFKTEAIWLFSEKFPDSGLKTGVRARSCSIPHRKLIYNRIIVLTPICESWTKNPQTW